MNNKIIITHTDLDGVCPIIINKYLGLNYHFLYINYSDLENESFLTEILNNSEVYFTDISPSQVVLDIILKGKYVKKVFIYDHHEANNYIADYKHEKLTCFYDMKKSGSLLYYENFILPFCKDNTIRLPKVVEYFVNVVNVYDLWLLTDELRPMSENLNRMFLEMANYFVNDNSRHNKFIASILEKFNSSSFTFSMQDLTYINKKIEKEQANLKKAKKILKIRKDSKNIKYGITKTSSCISFVAQNILAENNIEYLIILNTYYKSNFAMSIRSKESFNINELEKVKGHNQSGGYNCLNKEEFEEYYDNNFKHLDYKKEC